MPNMKPQQGPDPAVMEAIGRLSQTQLDPLQEVIFNSWMQANQLEEDPSQPFDYRGLYQQTNGKVHAPGELANQIAHQNAISTLMDAQQQHDSSSPMKMFTDHGGDPSMLGGGAPTPVEGGSDMGGGVMGGMMDGYGGDEGGY